VPKITPLKLGPDIDPATLSPEAMMLGNTSGNEKWQLQGPLSSQTILEEDDSDLS
jgi:hypothetical protein